MRWLMIGLFVSLVGLLIAAAGVAHHILIERREQHARGLADTDPAAAPTMENDVETDV